MQRIEYFRELASRVLDLPWAVADVARRAARPVGRTGEELWSSLLDVPWLARDASKRVALFAFGRQRSPWRATLLALVAVAAVLVVLPGVTYFAGETASGGVAGAARVDRQAARQQARPPATAFELHVRKPHIRAPLGQARTARTRAHTERLALIDRLAATGRRATAARARRTARRS